jgi:hypothetical protein
MHLSLPLTFFAAFRQQNQIFDYPTDRFILRDDKHARLEAGFVLVRTRALAWFVRRALNSTLAIFEWQEGKASFSIELLLHGKL